MTFTIEDIAQIVGGSLLPTAGSATVTGVSTDSRSLQPGDLFVPLHGPNYDGHDYLRHAVEHGAAACLSEEVVGGLTVPVVQVDDTLNCLGQLAGHLRQNFVGPVFAITGTTGKTSTKEMLASILSQQHQGLKTEGNFNNLIGLPLTLSRLNDDHRWMVLELGMSQYGEISRLAQIAQPSVALITNVGAGHLAGVGNIAGVAQAKGELFEHLKPGTTAIINNDDPHVVALPLPVGVKRLSFGLENCADIWASDLHCGRETQFTLHIDGQSHVVTLPLPGQHQVLNALAAAAAAYCAGVTVEQIIAGLSVVKMAAARLEIRELKSGITLLDDSYNANPQSMKAALKALGDWPCLGRKVAVLADMLELGDAAKACHRDLGTQVAQKADVLITMGDWSEYVTQGAASANSDGTLEIVLPPCTNHAEIVLWLQNNLRDDDCVLIKGSRGMHMEKIVQQIIN